MFSFIQSIGYNFTMYKKRISPFLIFLLLIPIVMYLSLALAIAPHTEKDNSIKSDAIFVLGARAFIDGKYNPCLEARMNHAIQLYKQQKAPRLILSGGTDSEDNINEAEVMKQMAIDQGIPGDTIFLEKAATSTYENFTYSSKILNDVNSIIIVTEPFHMPRASMIAKKLNINYTVSPANESPCWTKYKYASKYFLKEPLAIMSYKLQSKI